MRKLYFVFVTALILAGSTAAFGQRSAVMKPINQFVNGFNKGDMESAMAACSEATAIIDEFPPHTWSGNGACQTKKIVLLQTWAPKRVNPILARTCESFLMCHRIFSMALSEHSEVPVIKIF